MQRIRIRLRYATLSDTDYIIELLSELDRPFPKDRHETRKFHKLIENYVNPKLYKGNRGIILAINGSEIVGLVSFILIERLNQRLTEFWIPEIVVSKEYRRQGIGKLLVHKCETIATRKMCYRIRLESRNDRTESHDFYRKIGFQQIALVFEKRL